MSTSSPSPARRVSSARTCAPRSTAAGHEIRPLSVRYGRLAGRCVRRRRRDPPRRRARHRPLDGREARARSSRAGATARGPWSTRSPPPTSRRGTLLCASAVGFYGDRGDTVLEEDAPSGDGFLSEVCRAWEAEAARAGEHGVRVGQPAVRHHLRARRRGVPAARPAGAARARRPDGLRPPVVAVGAHRRRRRASRSPRSPTTATRDPST